MPIYNVLLEVPEWIQDGILNGHLVRKAAGIIRRVDGGQIVAHLREVGISEVSQTASTALVPLALGGLQMVTLCYVKVRFDRLEKMVGYQNAICTKVLEEVRRISGHQNLERAKEVYRGMEYLMRWRVGQEHAMITKAEDCFINGAADLWLLLFRNSAEELLGRKAVAEALLQAAVQSAIGELECKLIRGGTLKERIGILALHRERWEELRKRLEALPPPQRRFPTREMLQASPNRNYWQTRNEWIAEISSIIEVLEGQQVFEEALDQTEPQALTAWARRVEDQQYGVLCLIPTNATSRGS